MHILALLWGWAFTVEGCSGESEAHVVSALVMLRERTYSGLTHFVCFNKQERGFSYRDAFP